MKRSRLIPILAVVVMLGAALACDSGSDTPEATAPPSPTDTPVPAAGIEILEATFAHGLDGDGGPVDPGSEFAPDETVYLSLTAKGRPQEGTVSAQFYLHDERVAEADVDLSDVNSGVVFSVGEDTYVNFWLSSEGSLPISQAYRADVLYDDELVESYSFSVVPPPDALPTEIREVTLARGVDGDYNPVGPTTTFAPGEKIFLVAQGDVGMYTGLEVRWYIDGQLDEAGTNSVTAKENKTGAAFFFSHLPEGGWPEGEHQVALIVNDEEIGRYDFTIRETALVPFEDPEGVFSISYPADFVKIDKSLEGGYTYTFDAPGSSNIIYIFFGALDTPATDAQWEAFVEDYTLAGMPGFGQDTVELDRQVGESGVHALFLEAESKETNSHGLAWVEEVDGVMAIAILVVPIDEWPAREAEIRASLESFIWSPEAAQATLE